MSRLALAAACLLLVISLCTAQSASAAPQADSTPAASSLSQGDQTAGDNAIRGTFPTVLVKSIDSKKLKEGDTVICQTTAILHARSGMVIPNGSKVIGHVTQAKARSKGDSDSSLAFAFDKIQMPNGTDIPFKGTLQALAPSLGGNSGPDTGAAGAGTLPSGHGADMSTMPPPTSGSVAGPNSGIHPLDGGGSHPLLTAQSTGVLGIKNLQMDKDSVVTSSGKEVKLDSGTQMLIRAEIQTPVE
jgi:hypothetical protein